MKKKNRTLIIPCVGSRIIDGLPVFMNVYPDNEILALKCIESIFPHSYNRIIYTILKSEEVTYNITEKIMAYNKDRYNIEFVILDEMTSGPAETVYKTLKKANVNGEFAIRDSNGYISLTEKGEGNFIAGLDLTKYDETIENLRSKSFMAINENGQIMDIVEKHFCSDIISVGFYGFSHAEEFKMAYEHLCDPNYEINKLYVSHIISYLIGYYQKVFFIQNVEMFEDWSSYTNWQKIQKNNSLCLINIEQIGTDTSTIEKLIKLSKMGYSFIGYTYKSKGDISHYYRDINMLDIVYNCPNTINKIIINTEEDLEYILKDY